jgi:peroxiredoxin
MPVRRTLVPALWVLLLLGCGGGPQAGAGTSSLDSPAPDFTLKVHEGQDFTLSSLKGKSAALLVFFATWCPFCMEEVPALIEFQKAYGEKGAPVYAIDIKEDSRTIGRFVKTKGVNYRILLDSDAKVAAEYHVEGIPLLVAVGKDGMVKYRGHELPKDLDAFVKKLTE